MCNLNMKQVPRASRQCLVEQCIAIMHKVIFDIRDKHNSDSQIMTRAGSETRSCNVLSVPKAMSYKTQVLKNKM